MKNSFAANLKALRKQKAQKQSDLAQALNTTQRKISYWESGKIEPDIDSLWEIADYFDITIDDLIGRD